MKRIAIAILVIMSLVGLVGCADEGSTTETPTVQEVSFEDGTYRGAFLDGGSMQVGVQLKLEDNKVTEAKFRHLEYKGVDYRAEDADEMTKALAVQYTDLLDYLEGKDIREDLKDLYEPGDIVQEDLDAFTGATIRSSKVISAIRDGLNRGVYSY